MRRRSDLGTSGDRQRLVEVRAAPCSGTFLILDETTVRARLSFNVEQALDHIDIEESVRDVTITAWLGWKPDARHLLNPRVAAAGRAVTWKDVTLAERLGQRRLVDGARPDQIADPRIREPNPHPELVDVHPAELMRIEALGERTVRVRLKLGAHQLIDHLEVDEEHPDRVIVTAWVGSRPRGTRSAPRIVQAGYVTLIRALGARRLVDGSVTGGR